MDGLIRKLEVIAEKYEPLEEKRKREDAAKNGRVAKDEFQRIQFEIADQIREIRQLIKVCFTHLPLLRTCSQPAQKLMSARQKGKKM